MVLPVFQHLDVVLLEQKLLILNDEQRTTDSSSIGVNPNLPLPDVPHHGHLRHNNVHLPTQSPERAHEVLWLTVDTHPATIHKYLGGTGTQ